MISILTLLNKICFYFTFLLFCSSSKILGLNIIEQDSSYEVHRAKSKGGGSYITIGSFHFEDRKERAPAFYFINNIAIDPTNKFADTTITVQPGDFIIKGKYVSKLQTVLDKLTIAKGDSVYVKLYLKDDPKPLH